MKLGTHIDLIEPNNFFFLIFDLEQFARGEAMKLWRELRIV